MYEMADYVRVCTCMGQSWCEYAMRHEIVRVKMSMLCELELGKWQHECEGWGRVCGRYNLLGIRP